jgi:hypothetical protein
VTARIVAPEPLVEVGESLAHRALGRPADDGPVNKAPPSRPRLVLDDGPVRELAVVPVM